MLCAMNVKGIQKPRYKPPLAPVIFVATFRRIWCTDNSYPTTHVILCYVQSMAVQTFNITAPYV